MNLQIKDQLFVVGGATSGFGQSIAKALMAEGAKVIAIARTAANLESFRRQFPDQLEVISGDITEEGTINAIITQIGDRKISGAVINSGGPPAMSAMDANLSDWDNAYRIVFRWKIALTRLLVEKMIDQKYGRLVYVESVSVKQPVENLVLSNSMRLAVVGYVKTLSQEIGQHGITLNILGPGYHTTQRMENILQKNSELKGIPLEEVRASFSENLAVDFMGDPDDFAALAIWLLSPSSRFITGQTISVDGGLVLGTMG